MALIKIHQTMKKWRLFWQLGSLLSLTVLAFSGISLFYLPKAGATTDTFSSSGTWNVPSGVTSAVFEAWGGGGAGGGAGSSGTGGSASGTTGGTGTSTNGGNGGAGQTSNSNGGAGSTAKVVLSPEFVGATLTDDGTSNSGTMTSDFCSGTSLFSINAGVCGASEEHNYYDWTSNNVNDYDIWVRWSVPNDFASFPSNNNSYYSWLTGSGASDLVNMTVYPDNSTTSCASQTASTTTGSWQPNTIDMSGCTPNPGDILLIDIHLSVGSNGYHARIGEITLDYNRQ